jgi:NAD(P)-dependent dehydrogenase (short-subunit alcohol dehydrogenase family)
MQESRMTARLRNKVATVTGSARGIGAAVATLFLASDVARFINAADILIDGGRTHLFHE